MIRNAPPEIQISQIKQARDSAIRPRAPENVVTAGTGKSVITAIIENTQRNKLTAPNICIARIRLSLRRRLSICALSSVVAMFQPVAVQAPDQRREMQKAVGV